MWEVFRLVSGLQKELLLWLLPACVVATKFAHQRLGIKGSFSPPLFYAISGASPEAFIRTASVLTTRVAGPMS